MTITNPTLILTLLLVLVSAAQLSAFRLNGNFFNRRMVNRLSMLSDVEITVEDAVPPPTDNHSLFIGNIPLDTDESALNKCIEERVGEDFLPIRLAIDNRSGKPRGFGYLDYTDKAVAEKALGALAGMEIDGRQLRVDLSSNKADRPARKQTPQENSIFVGNIDFAVTQDQIMEMCNDLLGPGKAQRVRLVTDRETGRPRGFGHIDFENPEDATAAVKELTGVSLMGRELRVDQARRKEDMPPRSPRAPGNNFGSRDNSIFIGNLAWDVTQELVEEMLDDVLGPGLYTNVRLAVDKETGRPRGFGHVDFKEPGTVDRAIAELNGLEVLGRALRVDKAQRKTVGGGGGGFRGGGGRSDNGSFGAF